MRVLTKFMLVFTGYVALLVVCCVNLFEYNRGVRRVVMSEARRSASYILAQTLDYRHASYYRYLMQLRRCGSFDYLMGPASLHACTADVESATECYDFDGVCVLDSAGQLRFHYSRSGRSPEICADAIAHLQQTGEQDPSRFFRWQGQQLFEVCVAPVPGAAAAPKGYLAVMRLWTPLRLIQMDLSGTRNVNFHISRMPYPDDSLLKNQPLQNEAGDVVAYFCARYHSPLSGVCELLEREAMLQAVLPGIFAVLLFLCLLMWVIRPLRRLERALADGSIMPLKRMIRLRHSEFGKMAVLIGRFFDQNRQLSDARDAAQGANLAKSSFLATMSHEIRTPMNSLVGMLDLLKQGAMSEEQVKLVGIMDRSCESLLTIINAILDLSRIEAGKLQLHLEAFNFYQLVDDLEVAAVQLCADKPVVVDFFIDPDLPRWLLGDEGRVRQVLLNLIGNAVKFTDKGHVQVSALKQVCADGDCRMVLLVSDTGIGIDPGLRDIIFQTYAQASTEGIASGSGLGLPICKKLLELMDGTIEVQSTLGEGSVFSVELSLPIARMDQLTLSDQSSPVVTRLPVASLEKRRSRILIVEDQAMNALVLVRMLERLGCSSEVATEGESALELLQDQSFDLIFMDCHMPVMDGYECTRRIREMEKNTGNRIPILAVTADAMVGTRERCLRAGMDDYISKPVVLANLQPALSRYLKGE